MFIHWGEQFDTKKKISWSHIFLAYQQSCLEFEWHGLCKMVGKLSILTTIIVSKLECDLI